MEFEEFVDREFPALGRFASALTGDRHQVFVYELAPSLLARRRPRLSDRMCGGPLVEDLWCEVYAVGPGDRACLGVDSHLSEERGVAKRGEHALPLAQIGEIDVPYQAVREREPQPVMTEDLDTTDVVERRDHASILRQWRNGGWHLMGGHQRPIGEQLLLVERCPLEHLP